MNPRLSRRRVLRTFATAALTPALPHIARAQSWPSRPVKIIAASSSGGPIDAQARMLASFFAEALGQSFIVENRAGAAGTMATEAVAHAPPDGHILLLAGVNEEINATLQDKLKYEFVRDIAPIGGLTYSPMVMIVHPSVPAKTLAEFVAYAKANPGKLSTASGGVGAVGHLAGELFQQMTGLSIPHVPYRGEAPALTDVTAGQVPVMFSTLTSALELSRSGKLRAIAVTSAQRASVLPDVPTIGETLEGYQIMAWSGLATTKGVPAEIIARLSKTLNEALASPAFTARYRDTGTALFSDNTPENMTRFIAEDIKRWAKIIKDGNIKPE